MASGDVWTIKAALDWTVGYLGRKGDENPRLSAEWLLAEACRMRRIELYANFDRPLSMDERDVLRGYVSRRGQGEPLQYITGEVGFRHIAVKVRRGVLIPRPETEVLVSEALSLLPDASRPRATDSRLTPAEAEELLAARAREADGGSRDGAAAGSAANSAEGASLALAAHAADAEGGALGSADGELLAADAPRPAGGELLAADICTGSGCIACSLAYEHDRVRVVATDLEPRAVALARDNVAALSLDDRVTVLEGDLGAPIETLDEGAEGGAAASAADAPAAPLMGRFDLVVSNPPYVPTSVLAEVPREVADFEPALALDGGDDGLDVVRRLMPWCVRALRPGGAFVFELHEGHLDEAAELARAHGFEDVRIVRDLADRPRVLTGRRPMPA